MIPREFVISELMGAVRVKMGKGCISIPCPFHEEVHPSLSVSLGEKVPTGVWHCFGCRASGSWNALASKLGLTTVDYQKTDSLYYVDKRVIELYTEVNEDELTLEKLDLQWKSYDPKFLRKFGARKMWHEKYADYYLYLPVTFLGDYKGFIRARLDEESYGPKNHFTLENKIIYPFDYLMDMDTRVLVLVEGPADAFRLLQHGIPAGALLGTHLPKKALLDYIAMLAPRTIICCMDGDTPGYNATFGSYSDSGKYIPGLIDLLNPYYDVRVVLPPDGKDPDNMPMKYVKLLQHMVKKNKGSLLHV